jgi:hypothetical protein
VVSSGLAAHRSVPFLVRKFHFSGVWKKTGGAVIFAEVAAFSGCFDGAV